jgi:hypothetical protein
MFNVVAQAALSMEPGSRTPLPPSPTSTTNSPMHIINELNNVFDNSSPKQKKPVKPPRKVPLTLPHLVGREYDEVEAISHAWKTMGVDDFTHTENISNNPVELSIKKHSVFKEEPPTVPRKFITQPQSIDSMEDYDTLQHFGAQSANPRFSNDSGLYSQVRYFTLYSWSFIEFIINYSFLPSIEIFLIKVS